MARLLPALLILAAALVASPALACNPFGGDDDDNESEVVRANLGPPPEHEPLDHPADSEPAAPPAAAQPPSEPVPAEIEAPAGSSISTHGIPAPGVAGAFEAGGDGDNARRRVWAFLSQCVTLGLDELEAAEVDGQWFVQGAGGDPGRYGVWKLDPASGQVQPHSMRAREWAPRIGPTCTREAFAQFYQPNAGAVTEPAQAVTALWATLVSCYPALSGEDLQATRHPARTEWIVTARPEVTTNYGVWTVQGSGEVIPENRQAQGIHGQLDSGLC